MNTFDDLYDDARQSEFMCSYEDIVEYYPLTIKNERETYIKCRVDKGEGVLEFKLPSNEIIRAENLDDDALDEINPSASKRQYLFRQGCKGSATKLIDLPDSIEVFMVKFFREDDISAAPSTFDSDGCIWIYVEQWREHDRKSIALKLPTYEMIFADDCSDDLQNVVLDYLKSVEDIIVEIAKISETDCTPREYLNVKLKLVDQNAVLGEQLSFFNRKAFVVGQKYFIHCSARAWEHGCIRLYTYTGRNFVTDDGYRLDYSDILNALDDENPIFAYSADGEPVDCVDDFDRYNRIVISRRTIEDILRADGDVSIPIFKFDGGEVLTTVNLVRNELENDRVLIYVEAIVERDGRQIMTMPFIHLYAPQHSRYTRAELDDVDAFVEKFEDYLNRDGDHGWATHPMTAAINEFLINFGRLDKITRIKVEEAAQ